MEQNDTPTRSGSGDQQHIRLACQACQRKKIKCDRLFPCGQCNRSGLQCAPSTRKPRARHIGKRAVDSELRSRISKLESLVESLSGELANQDDSPGSDVAEDEAPEQTNGTPGSMGKYMSSNFWQSLTNEVQALKETLEEEPFEDADTPSSPVSSGTTNATEYDLLICPPGAIYVMPGALAEPDPSLSATLCNIFCEYVDRLFKVFHTPSLRAFMIDGKPYLGQDHSSPAGKALKAVVWYAAVNTMSETQCQMMFGQPRQDQMQQYKRLVDVALSQADLMVTNELVTLQAFSTYVAAARMSEGSRRMWTLTALAVRMGRSFGLDYENVPRSPFMTELRRRLWHFIRFLDLYTALDRGTLPLIVGGSFETPRGTNTNDADFDENSTSIPEQEGLTDMAYARLCYEALEGTLLLAIEDNKTTGETWQQRVKFADDFEKTVREQFSTRCNMSDPFQRLILNVSRSMCSTMKLRAVRPIIKSPSSIPPRVDSPLVLKIAVDCMRNSEAIVSDPETAQYRWMVWVQWHPLAVALAGLCSIRDTELANIAWAAVEQAYARNMRVVADTRNGMLWRPIEKLYKKASAFRDHGRTSSISKDTPPDHDQQIPPLAAKFETMMSPQMSTPDSLPPNQWQQMQQQWQQSQHPSPQQFYSNGTTIPGAMPNSGVLNSPMDFNNLDPSMMNLMPTDMNPALLGIGEPYTDIGNGDMSWVDFEKMLNDLSSQTGVSGGGTGDVQMSMEPLPVTWQQNMPSVPPGEDWGGVFNQHIM